MPIKSTPMSVPAARAYYDWTGQMATGMKELIADGSIQPIAGFDSFLDLSDQLRQAVKSAADGAERSGQSTFIVTADFSDHDIRTLNTMGNSLLSYIEILTLRGKLDGLPSPDCMEAIVAMTPPGA